MENNTPDSTASEPEKAAATPAKTSPSPMKRQPGPSSRHRRNGSSWWVRLSILISWLAAGTAIYGCYWLYLQLNNQQQYDASLNKEVANLAAEQSKVQGQITQSLNAPLNRIAQLEQQQVQNSHTLDQIADLKQSNQLLQQQVSKLENRHPNQWIAAEAEYLVLMASRKLWLENDPNTAVKLLQTADQRINAMNNPSLLPLRQALAHDISAVATLKATDVTGAAFAIDALIEIIADLPLNQADTNVQPSDTTEQLTDNIDDWQENLIKSAKQFADGFITIRKRTTDLEPLLPVEQQWYLVENVRFKLLQAQASLYRYDQARFVSSLDYAQNWSKQYFDLDDKRTQSLLNDIEKLKQTKLEKQPEYQFKSIALLAKLNQFEPLLPQVEPKPLEQAPVENTPEEPSL